MHNEIDMFHEWDLRPPISGAEIMMGMTTRVTPVRYIANRPLTWKLIPCSNQASMILPQTYQNIPFMHAFYEINRSIKVFVTVPSPSPECHSWRSQHWRVTNVSSSSPFGDRKPEANHWFRRWHTLILLQIDKPFRISRLRC